MRRCLELAGLGSGHVAPNPMVGAILVSKERIIGEGYHRSYGAPHAEVNCIASVKEEDHHLVEQSVLYVSLEPCAHYGKTPPCADLIIKNKIPEVVIGCRDPFPEVDGKGIEKLRAAGVIIHTGILENECREINKRFFHFYENHRPYVILKWAQTSNGKIAADNNSRLMISNEYTNRMVHKWRSEEMAILVGTNTAIKDDPELTTRLWPGNNPIRLVVDMDLKLPATLKIFNPKAPVILFNTHRHSLTSEISAYGIKGINYWQVKKDISLVQQIMFALQKLKIISLIVEGGTHLLQTFIDERLWDEARVITNKLLVLETGLNAPVIDHHKAIHTEEIQSDYIQTFKSQTI